MELDKRLKEQIKTWNEKFTKADPIEFLSYFLNEFNGRIALATSLGAEDQVITDMIASIDKSAKIFTLDTGRLFPETYTLIDETNKKYDIKTDVYFPDRSEQAGEPSSSVSSLSNHLLVSPTYWNIGKEIIVEEQKGKFRAEYGASLLKGLSESFTSFFKSVTHCVLNYPGLIIGI